MKHVGHTMGTPKRSIREAIALFSELGMDATEVISRKLDECGDKHGEAAGEAKIFAPDWDAAEITAVVKCANAAKVPFWAVTQYHKAINSPDDGEREAVAAKVIEYMDFAVLIGARYVRLFGGADGFGPDSWQFAVESLRKLGAVAESKNLTLLIENHPGTLTVTGEQTAKLVEDSGSRAVRVLYDPANVLFHSREDWKYTLDVQQGLIAHVHVKDFKVVADKRVACPVGEGQMPWREILARLIKDGYDGALSYEYEKKWAPEQLPDAKIGVAASLAFIKNILG